MKRRWVKLCLCIALLAGCGLSNSTDAANLVLNGDFSDNQFSGLSHELTSGTYKPNGITGSGIADWTNSTNNAYNLWFNTTNPTSVSAISEFPSEAQQLSASYNNTGLPDSVHGFLAMDGDPSVHGAVSQSISNLTVGQQYAVSFYWGATELSNRHGYTTERLDVKLGNSAAQSVGYGDPNGTDAQKLAPNAFTGWMHKTLIFTATNATETLSFLSNGTPGGEPPINLLADVSLEQVPEPSSLALSALGVIGLYLVHARRRAKLKV